MLFRPYKWQTNILHKFANESNLPTEMHPVDFVQTGEDYHQLQKHFDLHSDYLNNNVKRFNPFIFKICSWTKQWKIIFSRAIKYNGGGVGKNYIFYYCHNLSRKRDSHLFFFVIFFQFLPRDAMYTCGSVTDR